MVMRLQGFTKAGPANYSPMNLLCGTNGTEQRGGSKVVVIGCSKEFSNETAPAVEMSSQIQIMTN